MTHRPHLHVHFGGPGWDALLDELGVAGPAALPPIPPIRREQFGGVYRGVRLLRPWWRRRLKVGAILAALIVVAAVASGLIGGHLMLRLFFEQ